MDQIVFCFKKKSSCVTPGMMSMTLQLCLGLIGSVLVFGVAYSIENDGERATFPCESREYYLSLDFSGELGRCQVYDIGDPDGLGVFVTAKPLRNKLTPAEKRLFQTFKDSTDQRFGCGVTAPFVIQFAEVYGELPRDGADLLVMFTDKWATYNGYSLFASLPPDKQLAAALRAVNPATGKFYDSFQPGKNRSLALAVEKLQGEDALMLVPTAARDEDTGQLVTVMQPHQMWRLTLYGERPGSILLIKDVGRPLGQSQSSGSCGCGTS